MALSTNLFRFATYREKIMLLGFLCLVNLNVLVNSNVNEINHAATITNAELSNLLSGLDEMARSKVLEKLNSLFSNFAAQSSQAAFTLSFLQDKLTRAMEYVQKSTYYEFICALTNMKITTSDCYRSFGLHKEKILKKKHRVEYPEGFEQAYINTADKGCYLHNNEPINIFYTTESMKLSYQRWYKLVCGNTSFNTAINIKLKSNVDTYYDNHKSLSVSDPNYSTRDNFYKYFAAKITRSYKLGCLYEYSLRSALNNKWKSEIGNRHHLETKKGDFTPVPTIRLPFFSEILIELMPYWNFTEEDVEFINIVWNAAQKGFELSKGIKVLNARGKEVFIPSMDNCFKQPMEL